MRIGKTVRYTGGWCFFDQIKIRKEGVDMQSLILEIFDKVSINIPDLPEMEQNIAKQVEAIFAGMEEQMPQELQNEIEKRFFEVSGIAERKGFELGVRYMAKLLLECLS